MARGAMPNRMKAIYSEIIFERRMLLVCTVLIGIAVCIWSVAIGTNNWLTASTTSKQKLVLPSGDYTPNITKVFQAGNSGLFSYCVNGYTHPKDTPEFRMAFKECQPHNMFPPDEMNKPTAPRTERHDKSDPDKTLINYTRTNVSFAIITAFVMVMGFAFSIYTFRNPRYMFKRLAGGIHFITCACVMVVIQVLLSIKDYGPRSPGWVFPKEAEVNYGYSFFLAWFVFSVNLLSGFGFMLLSRKRKRDRAPNDELAMADEPTIIGR